MTRKGYSQEYQVRKMLEDAYGKGNVIKTASSQNIPDYIIFGHYLAFEVKSTVKKRLYLDKREIKQWHEIAKWADSTEAQVFYIVVYRRKPSNIIEKYTLDEFYKKFMPKKIKDGELK